jgi:general secretion pathway protein G
MIPSRSACPRPRQESGFTLLELIVVITIIGILSTFVVIRTAGWAGKTRVTKAISDMDTIIRAADIYVTQTGRYPETLDEMVNAKDDQGSAINCLEKYPKDPWNHEYIYEVQSGHPHVKCLGADGQEGGEGDAQDLERPEAETR